jgi:class 3 adenylate cyclase
VDAPTAAGTGTVPASFLGPRGESIAERIGHLHQRRARRLEFDDDDVEADYRAWHQALTLPFVRFGALAGAVAWIGNFLPHLSLPGSAGRAWPWMLVLGTGGLLTIFGATFTDHGERAAPFLGALGVAISALVSIVVSFTILEDWATASAGLVIIVYFGYAVMRLPPRIAATTGLAITASFQVVLASAFLHGDIASISFKSASTLAWTALATGLVFSIFVDLLTRRSFVQERLIHAQAEALAAEQARSERLLRNVLPEDVVDRLKDRPQVIADELDEVSVLFADIVGFTPLAAEIGAEGLVRLLNALFSDFDSIGRRLGIEKIKTIGDAYMAVAGAPRPRTDHAAAVAHMALELRDAVATATERFGVSLACRIGVATGPVVAGVIGEDKFAYDLWGPTVNLAARLESHGVPGRIQVSESTVARLRDSPFAFRPRGEVELKGIGLTRTWFLEGLRVPR